MNIIVEISEKIAKLNDKLEESCGNIVGALVRYSLLIGAPAAFAAIPWRISALIGMFLSAFVLLIIILPKLVLSIFGHEDIEEEEGVISIVKQYGRNEGFYHVLTMFFLVVTSYGSLFTSLQNFSGGRHFEVLNATFPLLDFQYFSLVTITTLGYGDVQPVTWIAKLLCMFEIINGLLVLYFAVAIVISASSSREAIMEHQKPKGRRSTNDR